MSFANRRVLIVGATSAIAQDVARILAGRGCAMVLAGRRAERLEAVAADLRARTATAVHLLEGDLAAIDGHDKLFSRAIAAAGGLDAVIVAYGVLGDQKEAAADFARGREILDANFTSAASWVSLAANLFERQGSGHIVAIGSVAGDRGRKTNYFYGAAKGALDLFLQGVRHRLAPKGIPVLCVKPGFVDTPMTAHIPKTPMFASPAEIAQGIVAAMDSRKSVVYLPGKWRLVMFVLRNLPEFVFNKLNI